MSKIQHTIWDRTAKLFCLYLTVSITFLLACSNVSGTENEQEESNSRENSIPEGVVKITPETDLYPPVIHSTEWAAPVPVQGPVNTAGIEDAAVISDDGSTLLFFFTPDGNLPAEEQLTDGVSGVWWCNRTTGGWSEPERALLASPDEMHLDGSLALVDDKFWFCSARVGNYNSIDIYTADFSGTDWINWQNAGQLLNQEYAVGELYPTRNNQIIYYANTSSEGFGGHDLWYTQKEGTSWSTPINLQPPINTVMDEAQPFISSDGNELWFTRFNSGMGYYGPAIYRSVKTTDGWSEPVEIVSNYVGDVGMDEEGNIYFTHLFYDENHNKIEADIYTSIRL